MSMGDHCELMAREWKISREDQDKLALASHQKLAAAYERGFFKDLVVPFRGLEHATTSCVLTRRSKSSPRSNRHSTRPRATAR